MQRGHVALRVDAGGQLALRDRVIAAVRHVLFARPDELDRRAGHLLRDQHGLADPVLHCAAPAEAAAEEQSCRPRTCASGSPDASEAAASAASPFCVGVQTSQRSARPARRRVHRLHRRVVLVRVRIDGLDLLRRRRERRAHIAVLVADDRVLRVEPGLEHLGERRARRLRVRTEVPFDRQRVEPALRVPPGVGDDGDRGVADAHDLLHAGPSRAPPCRRRSSPCRRTPGNPGSPRSACRAS